MDLSQGNAEEKLENEFMVIPVLYEYAKNLSGDVKKRYLEKVSLVGVHPPPFLMINLTRIVWTSYYTRD